jgi:hypothetical protein
VLRIARLSDPREIQRELDLYNRLLPSRNHLQAALLIRLDEARLREELAPWRELRGDRLRLHLGAASYPADVLTCRPEDRCLGAAHWIQFALDASGRRLLGEPHAPAYLRIELPDYHHESPPLSDDVRQSLSEDLALSDQDAAPAA